MKTADFAFDLPPELIAQFPARPRSSSRLLALDRATGGISDLAFSDLPKLLRPGDLLVVNDTRVIPARLLGRKPTGGSAEVFLLRREGPGLWEALVRASKKTRVGTEILLGEREAVAEVVEIRGEGKYLVRISGYGDPDSLVERLGRMPLPPYIRKGEATEEDREWYQTVYAHPEKAGSSAAPTAGLHFTSELFERLAQMGVERVAVTLHVGLGTFLPVRSEEVSGHVMHLERFEIAEETARAVNLAKEEGRRVVAVGTTATRTLETAGKSGRVEAGAGETGLFITPGYEFRIVDALATNFHLPESTLLMLVSAFGGFKRVLAAYRHAVEEKYRFYSYGDAMFIG